MKLFLNKNRLNEERIDTVSMDDIDNSRGTTDLFRVAFKNDVNSIFKYGYSREFTSTKGGNMYGPGVYCTYLFSDTVRNVKTKPLYGDCIIKMKLVGGFKNFMIFEENIAKKVYGSKWRIRDQLVNVCNLDEKTARSVERELSFSSDLYNVRTAPAAHSLWLKFGTNLFKMNVRGLIYIGGNDGHCALVYNFADVIPYSVSYDEGKTFQKKFNQKMFDHLQAHADVAFRFAADFEQAFNSVRGFTIVKNKSGKYNVIQNKTNKPIFKVWFDDIMSQINPNNGIFGIKHKGIAFPCSIESPEDGDIGCILNPFDYEPYCSLVYLDELVDEIKSNGFKNFEDYYEYEMQQEEGQDDQVNESKYIVKNLIEKIVRNVLYESHLKVVDNISEIVDLIGQQWTSPDDVWWIKIEARLKDYMNYNRRNDGKRNFRKKWWSRVNGPDGTRRENHVGYVIVRGANKEACQDSILNAVVHLNPWAAREMGTKTVYSNGNAEALKTVCHNFFARSYITINKRSMTDTINVARRDKSTGLFRGREFHHRVGQTRTGTDSSGVNWEVKRPLGLIDCDIDDPTAQAELDKYLKQNGVTPLLRKPSHDGMHYVISIKDAQGLDFTFLDKYATNNRPGDPNVLFKPDANLIVYSAVG